MRHLGLGVLLLQLGFGLTAAAAEARVETVQRHVLPPNSHVAIAPSEQRLAVVERFRTTVYVLESGLWQAYEAPLGYLGSEREPRRPLDWPPFGWTGPEGAEVFVPNRAAGNALAFQGVGGLRTVAFNGEPEPFHPTRNAELHEPSYERLRDEADRNSPADAPLPDSICCLTQVSPDGQRVLARVTDKDPLVSLDLRTGATVSFPLMGRPRALPADMSGSFSPDGEYVLVQYSYSPDDHYGGGFLQLFSAEGVFLEEVAAFHEDVPAPVGFHTWLSNGWIIYGDGKSLHFARMKE